MTDGPATFESMTKGLLKLNLGCGSQHVPGYVNVDKSGNPDVLHDLEIFPWPWEDNSVEEVLLYNVLEHLGETTEIYLGILKELYRICTTDAKIHIHVPHPRHDDFINDPTHVRMITPDSFSLFSKSENRKWIEGGFPNSPLGLYLDVDFEIVNTTYFVDPVWAQKRENKEFTESDVYQASRMYNNVIKGTRMILKVVK